MWTKFFDMCSGGREKEDFENCYIEAPEDEATLIFYNRFGHNPNRVTCTCCGSDYSISEYKTLEKASEYDRTPFKGEKISLEKYLKEPKVLVLYDKDIKPEERRGILPEQGYIWVD